MEIDMNVVIIGNGKVGSNLSELLVDEGHDITVVDSKPAALKKAADRQDIMCVEGNGATVSVQLEAGADKAGLVIAATPSDELNMLCCLIAKKLGAKKTISRVRNPEYFSQINLIKDDLGLSMVINPELTTADEIFRILVFPAATKVEVFQRGRLELVEHLITENSKISGKTLADLYKKYKIKFLICAVKRGSEIYIPDGQFVPQAGDRIYVSASHAEIERFFRASGALKDKIKNVMIVGGGRIAYYLALHLTEIGMHVKIIENNPSRCTELAELLPKAIIINADGTDQELLIEEGITNVDSFVSLTGMDEENIIMSLYAAENTKAKVVAKVNRDSYMGLASQIGLESVISPKYLTTSNITSYIRSLKNTAGSNIESLYSLVGNQVEAIEFKVRAKIENLVGVKLRELKLKKNILICAIIRNREIVIPNGNDSIEMGDSVVIVAKEHKFSSLNDILD